MIGVFDSGSGGLTILEQLMKQLPEETFLYLGDHANAPYGHRSNRQIVELTRRGVHYLMREGCSLVILACNTAAAVALRDLQQNWLPHHWPGGRVLGVLVPMVEAMTGVPWSQDNAASTALAQHVKANNSESSATPPKAPRRVLLLATRKTIESGAYQEETSKRAPHVTLLTKACPGLVDALEGGAGARPIHGMIDGYIHEALDSYGTPDAAVLGCTHFPLAEAEFRAALPASVAVYNQADIVARAARDYLIRRPEFSHSAHSYAAASSAAPERVRLHTTGDAPPSLLMARLAPELQDRAFHTVTLTDV